MCLSVYSKHLSIGIYHRHRVEELSALSSLIKAHRNHHSKLLCQCLHALHCSIFRKRLCIVIIIVAPLLTEILSLKKLRRKYYLCSCLCRSPYKLCCFSIFSFTSRLQLIWIAAIVTSLILFTFLIPPSHNGLFPSLQCEQNDYNQLNYCGICCVIQCIFPPPTIMSRAYIGYTFLPSKRLPIALSAGSSITSPNCGMSTPPFVM